MSELTLIGIDVSRDTLEVASSCQSQSWQRPNDTEGIEALCSELLGKWVLTPLFVLKWRRFQVS